MKLAPPFSSLLSFRLRGGASFFIYPFWAVFFFGLPVFVGRFLFPGPNVGRARKSVAI